MFHVLLLVSIVAFLVIRLIPGKIIDAMAADQGTLTQMDRARIEHALGLDKPFITQYGIWLNNVVCLCSGARFARGAILDFYFVL